MCSWRHGTFVRVQMASFLQGRGVPAMCYHAGLSAAQRQAVADAINKKSVRVVACTTALSTGLDMSSVDSVLHLTLPSSLEDYIQQAWFPRSASLRVGPGDMAKLVSGRVS
jgi:superfamily II DNA helicase RecQ